MRWRYFSIIFIFSAFYLVLVAKIFDLQYIKSETYAKLSESQYQNSGILEPIRGNIYFTDKNNNSIQAAINKDYSIIYVVPKEVQEDAERRGLNIRKYAEELSLIIDKPVDEIEKQLNKKNDLYELLVPKANQDQLERVKNLNFKGFYIKKQNMRFYPFGFLASHLIGFVSPANDKEAAEFGNIQLGRYGLELKFNSLLTGKAGMADKNKIITPKHGEDLKLTIDREIQAQSEEILSKLVEKWGASAGTIMVQEPFSGRILAMANKPDFDSNNYSQFEIKNFLNPAVEAIYEPGSVFKIITMSAGIDSGKITPDTSYIDTGSVTINSRTIRNWDLKAHGKLTMTNVIEKSINTGTIFAEKQTGHGIFYDYLNKFGFNDLTGINLPGEVKSDISHLKKGKDVDFATASFGQGVAITPISLISAVSTIANGGILMKPIVLADEKPQEVRRVISEDTANKVKAMMVSAVHKNVIAEISNYEVAGKTGTAYIPNFKTGGYTDEVIHSYVGFAPASHPRFVILIKLERPRARLAGETVVPVFKELTQFLLNYYNVAPDGLTN